MPATRALALAATALSLAAAPALAKPRFAATITRTTQGIPHIVAKDMLGLGYGSGYSAAEDNGCVIAETLVTVRGERSKFFGKDAKAVVGFSEIPNLESDIYHLTIGDLPLLRRNQAATSRDNRDIVAGFVAGYNRFLRERPNGFAASCRGAAWLRPMSEDDMLLLVNVAMTLISTGPYARQIALAAPPGAQTTAVTGPAASSPDASALAALPLPDTAQKYGLGSNGWAFGSALSTNKRGILVGNPHFPWTGPNRFRRLHLTIPGKFDVMGGGLVFMPTIGIGFNRDMAWTHTVTTANHLTLFELKLDPGDPKAYLVDGRSEPMTTRIITIEVKESSPITRTLYASRYGPIAVSPLGGLGWTREKAYAVRDADQANMRSGDAWLGIARARTVRQVRDAIGSTLGIPWVNTIAADRAGNALYADVTAVPNVSAGKLAECGAEIGKAPAIRAIPIFILDGSRAACDWDKDPDSPVPGLMPLKDLPTLIRADYVQNANDSYWLSNLQQPLEMHSPLLGGWGVQQNLRTRSALHILEGLKSIDPATARGLILGNRVHAAELVLDQLLALCPQRADLAEACAVLAKWDRRADVDSPGGLLFLNFWWRTERIRNRWATAFDAARPIDTPATLNPAAAPAILDALAAAVADMNERKIPLDAPVGAFQVAPRGAERIAIHGGPGSAGVLNAMQSGWAPEGLVPYHGTSYLQVVGFDEKGPVATSMLAYSQSTNPESPWFADGTRAYSAKTWLPLPFTPAQIAAARVGDPLTLSE